MKFGKVLRELRGSRLQKDVADELGVSRVYLSYLEAERNKPSLDMLVKLAGVYGVAAWQIVQQAEMSSDA